MMDDPLMMNDLLMVDDLLMVMTRCSCLRPHLLHQPGDLFGAGVSRHALQHAQEHPPVPDGVL